MFFWLFLWRILATLSLNKRQWFTTLAAHWIPQHPQCTFFSYFLPCLLNNEVVKPADLRRKFISCEGRWNQNSIFLQQSPRFFLSTNYLLRFEWFSQSIHHLIIIFYSASKCKYIFVLFLQRRMNKYLVITLTLPFPQQIKILLEANSKRWRKWKIHS